MSPQPLPLTNEDLPPTRPAFPLENAEEHRAFRIGAWAGICFGLALLSGFAAYLITPLPAKMDAQAWATTVEPAK
jgi:hypothetical protein